MNELKEKWNSLFNGNPDITEDFTAKETFMKFCRLYQNEYAKKGSRRYIGRSKVSEPFFRIFLQELTDRKVHPGHKKINVEALPGVTKTIDARATPLLFLDRTRDRLFHQVVEIERPYSFLRAR